MHHTRMRNAEQGSDVIDKDRYQGASPRRTWADRKSHKERVRKIKLDQPSSGSKSYRGPPCEDFPPSSLNNKPFIPKSFGPTRYSPKDSHENSPHDASNCTNLIGNDQCDKVFLFRTLFCEKSHKNECMDKNRCDKSHCLTWQRRNPTEHLYVPRLCSDINFIRKQGDTKMQLSRKCSNGKACEYSHSKEEKLYHPLFYKTSDCSNSACANDLPGRQYFCPFSHHDSEKRTVITEDVRQAVTCLLGLQKDKRSHNYVDDMIPMDLIKPVVKAMEQDILLHHWMFFASRLVPMKGLMIHNALKAGFESQVNTIYAFPLPYSTIPSNNLHNSSNNATRPTFNPTTLPRISQERSPPAHLLNGVMQLTPSSYHRLRVQTDYDGEGDSIEEAISGTNRQDLNSSMFTTNTVMGLNMDNYPTPPGSLTRQIFLPSSTALKDLPSTPTPSQCTTSNGTSDKTHLNTISAHSDGSSWTADGTKSRSDERLTTQYNGDHEDQKCLNHHLPDEHPLYGSPIMNWQEGVKSTDFIPFDWYLKSGGPPLVVDESMSYRPRLGSQDPSQRWEPSYKSLGGLPNVSPQSMVTGGLSFPMSPHESMYSSVEAMNMNNSWSFNTSPIVKQPIVSTMGFDSTIMTRNAPPKWAMNHPRVVPTRSHCEVASQSYCNDPK